MPLRTRLGPRRWISSPLNTRLLRLCSIEQLELPNPWCAGSAENIQSHSLCSHVMKDIDLLVPDRGSRIDRPPLHTVHGLDGILLHLLAVHQPFLGLCAVETKGLGEGEV